MHRKVVYLTSHTPHLPYLLVSLKTLRQHWRGTITVSAWPESHPIVQTICRDSRLDVLCELREPMYRGKNDQFLDKIQLVSSHHPQTLVLYLDADTSIHGSIAPLFDKAEAQSFCATQFNNWTLTNGIPYNRVKGLYDFSAIPKAVIDATLNDRCLPSVNGGVWAARPDSPVLPIWYNLSYTARGTFIADEKVLHLMRHTFSNQFYTIAQDQGRWNCSPIYQAVDLPDSEVVVRHYHGDSNLRPEKSPKGFGLWWPLWLECLKENLGYCQSWWKNCNNKYLFA